MSSRMSGLGGSAVSWSCKQLLNTMTPQTWCNSCRSDSAKAWGPQSASASTTALPLSRELPWLVCKRSASNRSVRGAIQTQASHRKSNKWLSVKTNQAAINVTAPARSAANNDVAESTETCKLSVGQTCFCRLGCLARTNQARQPREAACKMASRIQRPGSGSTIEGALRHCIAGAAMSRLACDKRATSTVACDTEGRWYHTDKPVLSLEANRACTRNRSPNDVPLP
mmetsp:Transcript_87868/g.174432  ORF Transcript_87868/g.174432 Transcript_87868/m.174432 type:complete len:227 (+) Transcript_87868:1043-1723(+)